MSYCYRCGVELDSGADECPLCGTGVPSEALADSPGAAAGSAPPTAHGYPSDDPAGPVARRSVLSARQRNTAISVLLLPAIPLLLLVWFVQEPGMRWILWTVGGIGALWLAAVPLRPLLRHPVLYGVVVSAMVSGIIIGVDATWGTIGWSLEVAVPVGLLVLGWFGAVYRTSRRFTVWGLPVAAAVLLAITTTVSIADGLVNRLYGEPFIGPTFVLLVAAVPLASLSLYLHRIGVRLDLRKVFHL
jgi:hypothetical protein